MSTRQRVCFPGIIRGDGGEATCKVWMTKVTLPGIDAVNYIDWSIRDVSLNLPDGNYEVIVNGQTSQVAQRNGTWVNPQP